MIVIYIYLSIIIGVPGTDKINLLKNKIILFTGIFIFELIINSFNKIYIWSNFRVFIKKDLNKIFKDINKSISNA